MSLLKAAVDYQNQIKHRTRDDVTPDEIELAVSWLKGEVTGHGAAVALYGSAKKTTMAVSRMAYILKEAFRQGIVKA